MATYRYIFLSLRDEAVIEEINLFGVFAKRVISGPGQFTGSFNFDQTGKNNIDLVAATTPGKTWLVMERDGVPVWWGIVWSRTYQSQAKECQIFAWGFESFPQKQKIETQFTRTGQPNVQIFLDLWTDMQSTTGRNININVPLIQQIGVLKNVDILPTDSNYYIDPMRAIADASDGFDWTIDLVKNADGSYYKSLRVGYPTLGAQSSNPNLFTFEYPGSILNYYQSESMSEAGTNIFVFGSGEGDSMPKATVVQQNMIDQGWPRWDVEVSYKDVTSQIQISALANQQSIVRKPPMPSFTVNLKADQDPIFGSYNVGDNCQLVITDSRNPSSDGNPIVLAYDNFTRSVSNDWGTSNTGQVWSVVGTASDYSVSGGRGIQSLGSVNVPRLCELNFISSDIDITVGRTGISAAPTGAAIEDTIVVRYVDSNNFVDLRVFRNTSGTPSCALRQLVNGVETFNGFPSIVGATNTDPIAMRLQAIGTLLRAMVWVQTANPPTTWNISFTTSHTTPGKVRVGSLLELGNTNTLPILMDFDGIQISGGTGSRSAGLSVPSTIIGFEVRPSESKGVEEVNLILPGDVING